MNDGTSQLLLHIFYDAQWKKVKYLKYLYYDLKFSVRPHILKIYIF